MKGRHEPVETLEEVIKEKDDLDKVVKIGSSLSQNLKNELIKCLRSHASICLVTRGYAGD